jgi:ATP-dependent DNA helicase RecG
LKDLDKNAIELARSIFKQKSEGSDFYEEIDQWDTKTFLNKARLTIDGKITKSTALLLGNSESKRFLFSDAIIAWIYVDENGIKKYSELFDPPFLLAIDKVLRKIRNEKVRFLPGDSLIPVEKTQYDNWIIREALSNCIAHQDYTRQSRIIVKERPDEIEFFNAGNFFQGSLEDYVWSDYTPPLYRNSFLASAMVNLRMIDSMGSGIKQMFLRQKERCLPLPDYSFGTNVEMTLYGKIFDEQYTNRLSIEKNLDLGTVFLLDKKQKDYPVGDKDYQYIIISHLKTKKRASREQINELLMDTLEPDLTKKQKVERIKRLIYKLSRERKIENISGSTKKPIWTLKK